MIRNIDYDRFRIHEMENLIRTTVSEIGIELYKQ